MNDSTIKLKELCNKYINDLGKFDFETERQIDELDKLITPDKVDKLSEQQIDEIGSKRYKLFIEGLKNKCKELYKFRLDHFNKEVESIFKETKLFESFKYHGIEVGKIDKLNFKSNGTINDYIEFFNDEYNKHFDLGDIWFKTLCNIKNKITPISFDTWFSDIELYEYKDNICKLNALYEVQKKHLLTRYYDLITSELSKIFNENVELEISVINSL